MVCLCTFHTMAVPFSVRAAPPSAKFIRSMRAWSLAAAVHPFAPHHPPSSLTGFCPPWPIVPGSPLGIHPPTLPPSLWPSLLPACAGQGFPCPLAAWGMAPGAPTGPSPPIRSGHPIALPLHGVPECLAVPKYATPAAKQPPLHRVLWPCPLASPLPFLPAPPASLARTTPASALPPPLATPPPPHSEFATCRPGHRVSHGVPESANASAAAPGSCVVGGGGEGVLLLACRTPSLAPPPSLPSAVPVTYALPGSLHCARFSFAHRALRLAMLLLP